MKNTLAKCNEDAYLPSLHLSKVELRCKFQEKLHGVAWLYVLMIFCFGRVVNCVERLDTNRFKFPAKPGIRYIEFADTPTA